MYAVLHFSENCNKPSCFPNNQREAVCSYLMLKEALLCVITHCGRCFGLMCFENWWGMCSWSLEPCADLAIEFVCCSEIHLTDHILVITLNPWSLQKMFSYHKHLTCWKKDKNKLLCNKPHRIQTDRPGWGGTPWTLYPSHLKQCSCSFQSHFRTQGLSGGGEKENIWRAVYQNKWINLCVKHCEGDLFVCPLGKPIFICCSELSCCWIIQLIFFFLSPQWSWKKNPSLPVHAHEMLMT